MKLSKIPEISVIIPCYNCEKFLARCLDSVYDQSFLNFEVICINDGSTDNTLKILKKFKIQKKLKLINIDNGGQGRARNKGLDVAQGKFIVFVDSDDYLHKDYLLELYKAISENKVDVAMCDATIICEDNTEKRDLKLLRFCAGYHKIPHDITTIASVPWGKIYKASLINKFNIRFPEYLINEDEAFLWFYMIRANSMYVTQKKLYFYVLHKGSTMDERNRLSKKIEHIIIIYEIIYNWLHKEGLYCVFRDIWRITFYKKALNILKFSQKIYKKNLALKIINLLKKNDVFYVNDEKDRFLKQLQKDLLDKLSEFYICLNLFFFIKKLEIKFSFFIKSILGLKLPKEKITPAFTKDTPTIVFSIDKTYYLGLSVTLQSLIENSNANINYDIVILENGIEEDKKNKILSQVSKYPNISVRFWNMNDYTCGIFSSILFVNRHLSVAAYYRLFIPYLFSDFKKVVYLDSDLCILDDIYNLWSIDIKNSPIAARRSFLYAHYAVKQCYKFEAYKEEKLRLKYPQKYFNSGVLIFNIGKLNGKKILKKFINIMLRIENPEFHDQDVLNCLFNKNVFFLPMYWNYSNYTLLNNCFLRFLGKKGIMEVLRNRENVKIIHYQSEKKPWNYKKGIFFNEFNRYAKKTPFKKEIIKLQRSNEDSEENEIKIQKSYKYSFVILVRKFSQPDVLQIARKSTAYLNHSIEFIFVGNLERDRESFIAIDPIIMKSPHIRLIFTPNMSADDEFSSVIQECFSQRVFQVSPYQNAELSLKKTEGKEEKSHLIKFIDLLEKLISKNVSIPQNMIIKKTYSEIKQEIVNSGLWDEAYYLSQFNYLNDPIISDPLDHYLKTGWLKNYNPSPFFNGNLYTNKYGKSQNPLLDFLEKGRFYYKFGFFENVFSYDERLIELYWKNKKKNNKAVYICITNDYDNLEEIKGYTYINFDYDYICFTDNKGYLKQKRYGIWQIRPLWHKTSDPIRNNRFHKFFPHIILPEYEESIYIDSNINILSPFLFEEIKRKNKELLLPRHNTHVTIYEELLWGLKNKIDNPLLIMKETVAIMSEKHPFNYGMLECNIIYRKHNSGKIKNLMDEWWLWLNKYSFRDQFCFSHLLWKHHFDINSISFVNTRVAYKDFCVFMHFKKRGE